MIRFTTDIVGAQILLFQEHATLGPVKKIIFSATDAAVLGFWVHDPILKKDRVLQTGNIKKMIQDVIVADGYDALSDIMDVVRMQEAAREDVGIIKETVVTESGQTLGKVTAAAISTTDWRLARLYVNPRLGLNFLARELIIPAKKIIRIEKKRIIVADSYAKVRAARIAPLPAPALDA